ncbi:hypothetical protein Y032_0009g606 [Ancylostoma ceylanicum]|uniref:Uncharacterized protein n=1 Tax=Ancylostoma ceylanicum TaxID=53326 RepID=A0A016VJN4_9BILA|nr:hypothetical protein Y032_0009g606 [Ancylostoma ceylanicum]
MAQCVFICTRRISVIGLIVERDLTIGRNYRAFLRMKTLVAVLSLCALAYTQYCPRMLSEIRQEDINGVKTVAYVTVTGKTARSYNLQYWRLYDVPKTAPSQWPSFGTLRDDCGNIQLTADTDYVLGCKSGNQDCFVKLHDGLSQKEKDLLKE